MSEEKSVLNDDISDDELMDDLGLDIGKSLKTAFDRKDISVSEDLIAATMARIKALEAGNTETTDNSNDPAPVTDITSAVRKRRRILRIAGPVAAALIIGIFGISIIRNNRMTKDSAADVNYAANDAVSQSAPVMAESSFSHKKSEESVQNSSMAETVKESAEEDNEHFEMVGESPDFVSDGTSLDRAGENDDTVSYFLTEEKTGTTALDPGQKIPEAAGANTETAYSFEIPAELFDKVSGAVAKYAAGSIDTEDYTKDIFDSMTGPYRDMGAAETMGTAEAVGSDGSDESEEVSEKAEEVLQNSEEIIRLVIENGVFYFTTQENMLPDEGTVVYEIEDPEALTEPMIEEIRDILE
ncbi:MAG: hypothetical protein K6E62_04885 [Lachnospiraceae bacterium]|nr:hypothetical protein [Lachnospiraceae bacterium]